MRPRSPLAAALAVTVVMAVGCGEQEYRVSKVGECLPASANVEGVREANPARVPCSEPHRYEVYAVTRLDRDGAWPGEGVVDAAADAACQEALASAGIDRNDPSPGVKVLRIQPSENSWSTQDDRRVECLIKLPSDRRGRLVEPANVGTTNTTSLAPTTPGAGSTP